VTAVTNQEQFTAAIDAHSRWFTRLRVAIETGKSDFDPAKVALDNQCDFGKWLHQQSPPAFRGTEAFTKIRTLHSSFHGHAGRILKLALAGKKAEALAEIADKSAIRSTSRELVIALQKLRDDFAG